MGFGAQAAAPRLPWGCAAQRLRGKCGGCGCAAYRHSPVAHSEQALPTLSVRDMHLFAAKMCWPDDLADQVGGPPSSSAPLWPLCRTPRAPPWPLYLAAISPPGSITHARPSSPHDRSLRRCVLGRRMPTAHADGACWCRRSRAPRSLSRWVAVTACPAGSGALRPPSNTHGYSRITHRVL